MKKTTSSGDETVKVAAELAAVLGANDVVWLRGPLGAGKTCFVRGLVMGLGGDQTDVVSPTYGLVHEYATRSGRLFHVDLYRLQHAYEVLALGLDALFGRGPVAIEWPELAEGLLGRPAYDVELRPLGGEMREVAISGISS